MLIVCFALGGVALFVLLICLGRMICRMICCREPTSELGKRTVLIQRGMVAVFLINDSLVSHNNLSFLAPRITLNKASYLALEL